jgi:tetratricopeptide (TPR) repeat protein
MPPLFRQFKCLFVFFFLCFVFIKSTAQTSDAYNDLAKAAYDKKDYNLCIEYCTKSIAISPNGWAYWERAAAYYSLQKYNESLGDYGKAMGYYSDNTSLGNLYYSRGNAYYNVFKYKESIEDYDKALSYGNTQYKYIYYNRGNAYYFTGQYDKAVTDFDKAIYYYNDDPKQKAKLYSFIADAKYYSKNYDAALEYFTKAIDTDPGDKYSYKTRAKIWYEKGEYRKAIADVTKALQFISTDPLDYLFDYELYQQRSLYYYYTGEYENGLKDAHEALKTDSSMLTYWRLGINYKGAKKIPQSVAAYRTAIVKTKDTLNKALLYRNIAIALRSNLDFRGALKEINTAISLRKNYKEAYWTRAEINTALKQYKAAIEDYDQCVSFYTDKSSLASLYKGRAELNYQMKDIDRAMYDYNKVLELYPENIDYLYNAGRFLVQSKKDISLGKQKLEKAASLDLALDTCSDYSYAKFFLGDITAAINNSLRLIDRNRQNVYQHKWDLHILGCLYALSGNTAKAIEYLDKSFAAGFDDYEHLHDDRDLRSIVNLPQYKALLTKYKIPVAKL